jgi:hypothetical protein
MLLVLEQIIITDSVMGTSVDGSGLLTAIAIRSSHLIAISVRCHGILMGLAIHLSDECSVKSFSRLASRLEHPVNPSQQIAGTIKSNRR